MTKESSLDQKELNKFNKTPDEWWDESGEFKLLHKINHVRIKYIKDKIIEHFNLLLTPSQVSKPLAGLEVIDVGCGGGLISTPIYTLGAKVTAIDANSHNIKALSEYSKKKGFDIDFINSTVEGYINAFRNKLYDVVICLEVIEHVANQKEFAQNLVRLLKPTGILILSTINRTIKSYVLAIIAAEYILKWVPVNTHNHSKFVKPSELHNFFASTNFQLRELVGLKFNPIRGTWDLSDDIDVNYFACITLKP